MPTAVATGYYRFTDIIFEWHAALPDVRDVHPLKAMISYNALVHPDHPLRKPGLDGLELYLGTFANGEMRLLFSSAQIEYIRYWLHAMRLTAAPLPLPHSDNLLQAGDLTQISPCVYTDASKLKKAVKTIDKNNKRIKGGTSLLTARRLLFEKARTLWAARAGAWLALDFEAWDLDHTVLTEFGWSLVAWDAATQEEVARRGHWIVREHRGFSNKYVAQWRDKYLHGQSEDMDRHEFKKRIQDLIAEHSASGPLFLVFHDASQDIKYLRAPSVQAVSELEHILPDAPPAGGRFVVDTAELFAALEGESGANRRGLEQMCRHLQVPADFMHNAGNDAHCTMLAFRGMASGAPVDEQREARWPNRTASTDPRVQLEGWDDDDDDDLQGIMPPGKPVGMPEDAPAQDGPGAQDGLDM